MKHIKALFIVTLLLCVLPYARAQEGSCSPAQFRPHQPVEVATGHETLALYSEAALESEALASLQRGDILRVAGEAACINGELWYPVQVGDVAGWLMEGASNDPWLAAANRFAFIQAPADDIIGHILVRDTVGHTLLDSHTHASELSWSPDGGTLVFSGHVDALPGQHPLFRLDIQQAVITALTTGGDWFDNYPVWSPDGEKIVYSSYRDNHNHAMWIINADGSGEASLLGEESGSFFSQYAWSPDSQQIAFVKKLTDVNTDVMLVNADGSGETSVSNGASYEQNPVWSPDGKQIAYDDGSNIILVSLPDLEAQTLTSGTAPAWSPDGTQVLFQRDLDIFWLDLGSGQETQVTNTPNTEMDATWSPDGAWIAYVVSENAAFYLHVQSLDGAQAVVDGPLHNGAPHFAGYVWLH